ncbi:MAG: SPOR domain-containing protein [Magnetococcales bacterium]|nr:SPOR domain-containing protein [Magnetococcales bacterium]
MKTSSSREQQLFLIAGGSILFLILAVVVFNMVSTPSPVPEVVAPPVSKVHTAEAKAAEGVKEPGNDAWKINLASIKDTPATTPPDSTLALNPKEVVLPGAAMAEKPEGASGSNVAEPLGKARQMLDPAAGSSSHGPGKTAKPHGPNPVPSIPDQEGSSAWNHDPGALESARKEGETTAPSPSSSGHPPMVKPTARQPLPSVKTARVADKSEKVEKPEKIEKPEKLDKQEKADKSEKTEKPEKVEKVEKVEKAVVPPPEAAKPVHVAKVAQPPKPIQAAKPAKAGHPVDGIEQVIASQFDKDEEVDEEVPLKVAPAAKKPAATKPSVASPSGSGYQIQIASFATADKAQAMVDRIAAVTVQGRRIPVSQTNATINGKTYFRVRAGPFGNRDNAQAALQALSQKAGISGSIVGQD